jgi:hypothetical protein
MSGEGSAEGGKPDFTGKYSLLRNENFDEFLAANGANWLVRKMATTSSPNLDVTQDGDKVHMKLHSLVHSKETQFTVGEPFEETQQNGAVMKVTPKWEGKRLILSYEPKEESSAGKPQTHTRELEGDELTLTLQVDNVTAKRVFKKNA